MSPILKFLAAARSLASQGFKKEQIYEFAQREFGEINELMQKQIENIFKPQKPTISRNKPLDPDDVLPNYNETPGEFARRETPGSKENLLQELKIAYGKEFDRLRGDETAEELKEMLKNLDTDGVPFASGGRAGYYGGGQAMVGEDLSEIGHGSDSLMARNMQLAPNSMATTSTGLNYLLGEDNDTVRVPYVKGKLVKGAVDKGRRGFMKAAGATTAGIAALKTGLLGFGKEAAPVVEKAAEAVSNTASQVPAYFLNLVKKIKTLGDDTLATKDKAIAKKYKDYTMEEDFAGNIEIIKKGDDVVEDVFMSYKVDDVPVKGKKGSTKVEEYEEYTARPDADGKMKDIEQGVPDEVVQEGTVFEDTMSEFGKAEGGRIGFGKGDLVTKGIPALLDLVKNKFGKKSITTLESPSSFDNYEVSPDFNIKRPESAIIRDKMKNFGKPGKFNDDGTIDYDYYAQAINDSENTFVYGDETIEELESMLQKNQEYMDDMYSQYKAEGGSKRLGGPNDPMKAAINNASPGYTGDLKYDAQLVADDLAEKMYGVEYDDLTQAQQMDLYGKAYTALSKNEQGFKQMQKLSKPKKTLEGIKKTGVVDISDPDVAEEFTKFMKETDPKGYKNMEQKIQLESFDPKKTKGNAEGGRIGMLAGGGILKAVLKNSADKKGMTVRDFVMAMNPRSIPSEIKKFISKVDLEQLKAGYKSYYENISDMMKTRFDFQKNIETGKKGPASPLFENLEKTMDEQSYVPKNVTQEDIAKTELMIKNKFFGKDKRKLQASGGLATMLGE